jgi:hypothetical protein
LEKRLYFEEKLCVPYVLTEQVINEHHAFLGHIGGARLQNHILVRYNFAEVGEVKKYCQQMTRNCPTCEACVRTQSLKGPLGTTIIPPQIMIHVAIDLFNMPSVKHEGSIYDMMAVCVDRHSGWIVAVPVQNKGLTGAKVAKAMFKYQWRPFGIPSIITSDQGSHFTGEWWRTMDG